MIPKQAIIAAKEAMREVTPPPGVSKADWLAEHGDFALIAGAIAAAALYLHEESYGEGWDNAKLYYENGNKAAAWEEGREVGWADRSHERITDNPYGSES